MELEKIKAKLPGLDCGDCGFESCVEMAKQILAGQKNYEDCVVIRAGKKVVVKIGGKDVPIGSFVQDFVKGVVLGMLSSLKKTEIKAGDEIEIKIKVGKDDL